MAEKIVRIGHSTRYCNCWETFKYHSSMKKVEVVLRSISQET